MIATVIGGLVVVLLLLALVWWLSRIVADPIRDLARVAHDVAHGSPARAAVRGPREIENVARQFNEMLDALARNYEERFALSQHVDTIMQNAPDAILLSDEKGRIVEANEAAAGTYGHRRDSLLKWSLGDLRSGEAAPGAATAWAVPGDLLGTKREEEHRRGDGSTFPVEISSRVLTVEGHQYLQSFVRDITDRRKRERELRDYAERVRRMFASTVEAISTLVEQRDPYTAGHERRVGILAAAIAAEMGLDANYQEGLRYAAALHDVGKISIPIEILTKPGRLNPIEMQLIRTHAEQGYEALKWIDAPWPIAEVARQHHERMDGSGYPRGLKGEEILLEARIVAVADVVESMTSHRPYRPGLGIERALREIELNRGVLYDSAVADACLRLFRIKAFELSDLKAA